jgi:short-subunit dehydrogenase
VTAVVVGASSGLGRALALELARAGQPLLLVASDRRDLVAAASDLSLRFGVRVETAAIDLATCSDPGAILSPVLDNLPPVTALLLPVGMSRSDDDGSLAASAIGPLLAINLHAPVSIVHSLLPLLLASRGVVVGFGSIAAARGRSRNRVYAAAKRGLESYFESLRHSHRADALRVQFYRLGFLRSNLTFGLRLPLPVAEPADVARTVVRNLRHASFSVYQPRWWGLVGLIVRTLPWPLFRRMRD